MRTFVLLVVFMSSSLFGGIEPFGNLKWSSQPEDVVSYLCANDDIEEIAITQDWDGVATKMSNYVPKQEICNNRNLDIVSYAFGIDEAKKIITSQTSDHFEKMANETYLESIERRFRSDVITYDDINYSTSSVTFAIAGKTINMFGADMSPIYIFSVNENYTGYSVLNNAKGKTVNFGNKEFTVFPKLTYVRLEALNFSNLSKEYDRREVFASIKKTLADKYSQLKLTEGSVQYGSFEIRGPTRNDSKVEGVVSYSYMYVDLSTISGTNKHQN